MPIVDNPLVLPPLPIIRSFSLLLNSSEDKIKVSILYVAMEKKIFEICSFCETVCKLKIYFRMISYVW